MKNDRDNKRGLIEETTKKERGRESCKNKKEKREKKRE